MSYSKDTKQRHPVAQQSWSAIASYLHCSSGVGLRVTVGVLGASGMVLVGAMLARTGVAGRLLLLLSTMWMGRVMMMGVWLFFVGPPQTELLLLC